MIAYYEKQAQYPPTHRLAILAKALGVSVEQLLGIEEVESGDKSKDMRLWRRFRQIEKLDAKEKRQVIQLLDTFIEKDRLKKETDHQPDEPKTPKDGASFEGKTGGADGLP